MLYHACKFINIPPLRPARLLVCLSKCRKLLSNATFATERRWVNSLSLDIHTLSKMILHLDGYIVESTGSRDSCTVYKRGTHNTKSRLTYTDTPDRDLLGHQGEAAPPSCRWSPRLLDMGHLADRGGRQGVGGALCSSAVHACL